MGHQKLSKDIFEFKVKYIVLLKFKSSSIFSLQITHHTNTKMDFQMFLDVWISPIQDMIATGPLIFRHAPVPKIFSEKEYVTTTTDR